MRLLLDTHILIWWHENNPRLNQRIRIVIQESESVFVSLVSAWEAAIKVSLGRLKIADTIETQIAMNGFIPLELEFRHIDQTAKLPLLHRDPFDRMLVAQAQSEDLYLVTDDAVMRRYDVKRIEV